MALLPVEARGLVMLLRWLPGWQAGRGGGAGGAAAAGGTVAAERHLPVPVIVAHGLLAVVTLVLALLAAAGGS